MIKSLLPVEENYSTPEKEFLSLVRELQGRRAYIAREKSMVHSNNSLLRWLLTIAEPSGKLMRYIFRLSEFNFQILYKKRKLNNQADAQSRFITVGEGIRDRNEDIPYFLINE